MDEIKDFVEKVRLAIGLADFGGVLEHASKRNNRELVSATVECMVEIIETIGGDVEDLELIDDIRRYETDELAAISERLGRTTPEESQPSTSGRHG